MRRGLMGFGRISRACLCAAVTALMLAGAACKDDAGKGIRVRSIKFIGVHGVDKSALEDVLATRASSKLPWGAKRYFYRNQFDDDLKRIRAFYADRGFPDAKVTSFDVKLNAAQDTVDATITIDEGEPVVVSSITFSGFDVIPERHLNSLKRNIPIKAGKPRDRQVVLSSREMALDELRDHGYPYASVRVDEVVDNTGTSGGAQAQLTLVAVPGKLAHFGPTEIQGNDSVSENTIRRSLTLTPGKLYERRLVQDTQRRLYGMSLFQFVNVEPVDLEQQPPEVPMKVTVAEGPQHRVNFSVGYGTEEQARIDAEYHRLNFLGAARSAGAHVRWSSLDRGVQLDFNQPYLFHPRVSLSWTAQDWLTFTPAYQSTVIGTTATTVYQKDRLTSFGISVTAEHDKSSIAPDVQTDPALRNDLIALGLNPETGEQSGTLNALRFEGRHATTDNLLDSRKGYILSAAVEQAGVILPGGFKYTGVSGEARHYLPIAEPLVLASRLQVANLAPASGDPADVPFAKKYFLGGATTIRGWGRYEVSPLSLSGLPIGGNSLFLFSSELRAHISGHWGSVAFLDAGNVWAQSWGIRLDNLRYAVGAGLRYQTPIGPLRLDWGYQLNPIPGLIVNGQPQTRRWRIHFSIGQAY
jgi:outer membrane protein insertion porin family/translocation and assembly module TamA